MAKSNNASAPAVERSNKPSTISNGEAVSEASSEAAAEESIYGLVWISIFGYAIYRIIYASYRIRMGAIDEYGPVIHEFDPYFNFRATEVRTQPQTRKPMPDRLSRAVFFFLCRSLVSL
jgi:dolichyl-diphosphooligosaccharide--protein glycosyltransferase